MARMWPAPQHVPVLRAALGPPAAARAAFAAWAPGADPDTFDAATLRLLPSLGRREDLGEWPPGLAEQMRRIERFAWVQAQARVMKARPVLEALAAAGIPIMLAKGIAVVHATGASPRARPMDDVDLVVPRAHAERATEIVIGLGYATKHRLRGVPPGTWDELAGTNFSGPSEIDLHAHVLARSLHPRADDAFWAAATPVTVGGVECLVPRREDLALQAIVHALPPMNPRPVRWLSDLALLAGEGFDWDRLRAQARAHHVAFMVEGALQVLAELTAVDVPRRRAGLHPVQRLATRGPNRRAPLTRRELLADEYLSWRAFGRVALRDGWWAPEPHGTWSRSRLVTVAGSRFTLGAELHPLLPERTVIVFRGVRPVARWRLTGSRFGWHERTIRPGGRVRLLIGRPASGQLLGLNGDHRPVGVTVTAS